jgi:cellulose synthase/poly-beta-1,6-N-acetylglucosamine synthase-like glycosyltransferase
VEDMDLTVNIASRGNKIKYLGEAIAYTEAPEDLKSLYKQRYRWYYGFFQVFKKYKHLIFKDFNNNLFTILFPYTAAFMVVDITVTILIIGLPLLISFEITPISKLIPLIFLVAMMEFLIYLYSSTIDNERKRLIFILPVFLIYTQFLNLIILKTFCDFILKRKPSWNKIKRLGKNKIRDETACQT